MLAKPLPPIEYLRECFDYDPETGVLTWRERPAGHFHIRLHMRQSNTRCAGKAVRHITRDGYLTVKVNRLVYLAHRIAWALGTGEPPPARLQIDHINGIKTDNRLANLRLATPAENTRNHHGGAAAHNRYSGILGVYPDRHRWIARAGFTQRGRRKVVNLGSFDTKEQALAARIAWEQEHYGAFAPKRRS